MDSGGPPAGWKSPSDGDINHQKSTWINMVDFPLLCELDELGSGDGY
jgi:hypothetical protein